MITLVETYNKKKRCEHDSVYRLIGNCKKMYA